MTEKRLHKAICKYIKLQHPNIYFLSDPSGLKMSIGMATELKATRSKHAQLDVVILQPNSIYNGLILEVKRSKDQVYKKNGDFRKSKHVEEQNKSIAHLRNNNYICNYVFDLQDAIDQVEMYLKI